MRETILVARAIVRTCVLTSCIRLLEGNGGRRHLERE